MRLINMGLKGEQVRLDFFGCNLKCPYCIHIRQPFEEYSIDEVAEFVSNSAVKKVFIGGAEPTLQKDLIPLIERLHSMGMEIILKSDGMKPEVLEQSLPFVKGFVLELKAPLEDTAAIEELTGISSKRVEQYVANLKTSIDIAKTRWLRLWVRVIPGYVTEESVKRMLPVMEGASEVLLYQFLSNSDFDLPFAGYTSPVPAWEDMESLAAIVVEKVPRVIIVGEKGRKIIGKE